MTNTTLTYKQNISRRQAKELLKICFFYFIEFAVWILAVKLYRNFGTRWITPCVSAMWIMGAVTCFFIPEQRESTISTTKWIILGYVLLLLLYRGAIQLLIPLNGDQMNASLNISGSSAAGIAITGLLQNLLFIFAAMGPIAYLIYLGKEFAQYRGKSTKSQAFTRIKGMR